MVEGEGRHFVDRKPLCLCCIVASLDVAEAHKGIVGYADDSLARVAVRIGKGMELPDIGCLESCFLKEFSLGSVFSCFVDLQKTARECPSPFVGLYATLYEQDIEACAVKSEYHTVGGDTRVGVLVVIIEGLHILVALNLRSKGTKIFVISKKNERKSVKSGEYLGKKMYLCT